MKTRYRIVKETSTATIDKEVHKIILYYLEKKTGLFKDWELIDMSSSFDKLNDKLYDLCHPCTVVREVIAECKQNDI